MWRRAIGTVRGIWRGIAVIKWGEYRLEFDPKPIPSRAHDWNWTHIDYDGAPDSNDIRCGTGASVADCVEQIREIES